MLAAKPRVKEIRRILKDEGIELTGRRKIAIAQFVAERMSQEQIPTEIEKLIENINRVLTR